jgi:hypothetical protein
VSDHEHDEQGNCIVPENGLYSQSLPVWQFSMWEMASIGAAVVGGLGGVLMHGANMLAREFAAKANFNRQNHDLKVAREQARAARAYQEQERAKMAAELERLIQPGEES